MQPGAGLTLEHFVLRSKVIELYRKCVRLIYRMPANDRKELHDYCRSQFERHRGEQDLEIRKQYYSIGKREYNRWATTMNLAQV